MTDDLIQEMRALCTQLNTAADAYYAGRDELMTDFEWDALFERLKALEAKTGVVLPESPTNRVSTGTVAGEKDVHGFPALSLAKTKSIAELVRWSEGRPIWISWKLDGLTLVVTYDEGRLLKVVTRGDGHVGTNITHLATAIAGIPATIPTKGHVVVRGEAVISYADFKAFCADSQEEVANPRNLASGSLTLKDVDEVRRRQIRWIPFTLVFAPCEIATWGAAMTFLRENGFAPVESTAVEKPTLEAITHVIDVRTAEVTSFANPYPVDGLVIVYDDLAYAKTGSVTGHHATRAGIAFKWQDEEAKTRLQEIEWSCAIGSITPIAVFEPVELEGTTVRRANLCNISECERLGIGGEGTLISVIKANKIIPKVVRVETPVGAFAYPHECPVCHAPTQVRESTTGTRQLICTNAECPAKALRRFERFVSKDGFDIDGLAGETLAAYVNAGLIRDVDDILHLPEKAMQIMALEGMGQKKVENLTRAISVARRERSAVNFLVALAIPLCGAEVARRLLLTVNSVDELIAQATNAPEDVFSAIDGIGPAKSASFVKWVNAPAHRALLERLLPLLTLSMPRKVEGGTCQGLTFVITGDVHHWANRAELKDEIVRRGGSVAGAVSSKTSFLINNDAQSTSGKNKKAQALGIPILTEEDFIARFISSQA